MGAELKVQLSAVLLANLVLVRLVGFPFVLRGRPDEEDISEASWGGVHDHDARSKGLLGLWAGGLEQGVQPFPGDLEPFDCDEVRLDPFILPGRPACSWAAIAAKMMASRPLGSRIDAGGPSRLACEGPHILDGNHPLGPSCGPSCGGPALLGRWPRLSNSA